MEIRYRRAEERDIDDVCRLVSRAIDNMERHNIFQWDNIYPARDVFIEDIRKKELFVGIRQHEIVVIYTINKECDAAYQNGNWQYPHSEFRVLHRLCVHPDHQNSGIAKSTLCHMEAELKKQNIEALRLDVFGENPFALRLYRNQGYRDVGYADWRKGRFYLMEKAIVS